MPKFLTYKLTSKSKLLFNHFFWGNFNMSIVIKTRKVLIIWIIQEIFTFMDAGLRLGICFGQRKILEMGMYSGPCPLAFLLL